MRQAKMLTDAATLLFLLLPFAALSGYWVGTRQDDDPELPRDQKLNQDYLKGLNFLLNERPDKAIEVFLRLMEVDNETVETHLALGALFRQRGEVDRALRIHQNLIARPNLAPDHRRQAVYELAEDYMKTGIYDRAENLYLEIADGGLYTKLATQRLLRIYEQGKDWPSAIDLAKRNGLGGAPDSNRQYVLGHYYCELAELALNSGNRRDANQALRKALQEDERSVRAMILSAKIAMADKQYRKAIKLYRNAIEENEAYANEVLNDLVECHIALGQERELTQLLESFSSRPVGIDAHLRLMRAWHKQDDYVSIKRLIQQYLDKSPTILVISQIIGWLESLPEDERPVPPSEVAAHMPNVLKHSDRYQCSECGFSVKHLHWQCPTCKSWGTMKPIKG